MQTISYCLAYCVVVIYVWFDGWLCWDVQYALAHLCVVVKNSKCVKIVLSIFSRRTNSKNAAGVHYMRLLLVANAKTQNITRLNLFYLMENVEIFASLTGVNLIFINKSAEIQNHLTPRNKININILQFVISIQNE